MIDGTNDAQSKGTNGGHESPISRMDDPGILLDIILDAMGGDNLRPSQNIGGVDKTVQTAKGGRTKTGSGHIKQQGFDINAQ
eukprot:CAMPEP_0172462106 /NCGR_PEP_ID=MMETSP1065-20121228/42798_1 /TAXON_ID=265537 /ORGANISM="Amphiprora paludosa, Strain CCMP125" /LENGTH=81 /DNA_ID=CAMNT_0013217665 /DNA_START=189 /DNA_END=434 /DNA_ORIENTATION=-